MTYAKLNSFLFDHLTVCKEMIDVWLKIEERGLTLPRPSFIRYFGHAPWHHQKYYFGRQYMV